MFNYGAADMKPIAGDWNSDGRDTVGRQQGSQAKFYLTNSTVAQQTDISLGFGLQTSLRALSRGEGTIPLAGDWNGPAPALRTLSEAEATDETPTSIAQSGLQPLVTEAIARWTAARLPAAQVALLNGVKFVVADLPGTYLGIADGNTVYIDRDAAGYGWFIDSTPTRDEEFADDSGRRMAVDPAAVDRIDLLTVVAHELGHIASLDDIVALSESVMNGLLDAGIRRNPRA